MTKTASEEATEENPSISKHQQWRKSLPKLARLTKNLRAKGNLPELALLSEILAYSAIFSYFSVQKFREFSIYAWDFGVYSQAISTTLTSGTLFYSTLELPYTQTVIPAGTQFAVHFTPFLFAILPLYAMVPGPVTLLVVKSVAVGLGAIPVYFLAKSRLSSARLGLLFSTAYLLSPGLQGVNWYDFQPQAFLPTFLLFALLYVEKGQTKSTLFFLLLAFSTVELAPILAILIGISIALHFRKSIREMILRRDVSAVLSSFPAKVILVSCAWLAVFYVLSVTLGWQGSFHPSNLRRISLVSSSVFDALSFDWQAKLLFVALIFGPVAFFSLFDLPRLLPAGFWMAVALLSNFPTYYQLSVHYPVFIIPFVTYSAIFGFGKLSTLFPRRAKLLPILLCCTMLLSALVASPLSYLHLGNWPGGSPGLPIVTAHDASIQELVDLVPRDASVLTQNNIFPHLSERRNAYAIPFSSTFQHPGDFYPTLDSYLVSVDYALVDGTSDPASATIVLSRPLALNEFGLYAEADGAMLLRKGYGGSPILFVPVQSTYDHRGLVLEGGTIVNDPSSMSGLVLYRDPSKPTADFWYGPGVFLNRGNFSVTFRMKVTSGSASSVVALAIVSWPTNVTITMNGSPTMWYVPRVQVTSLAQEIIATSQVTSGELSPPGTYQSVSIQFRVMRPGGFEFVGLNAQYGLGLSLDTIQLSQVSP